MAVSTVGPRSEHWEPRPARAHQHRQFSQLESCACAGGVPCHSWSSPALPKPLLQLLCVQEACSRVGRGCPSGLYCCQLFSPCIGPARRCPHNRTVGAGPQMPQPLLTSSREDQNCDEGKGEPGAKVVRMGSREMHRHAAWRRSTAPTAGCKRGQGGHNNCRIITSIHHQHTPYTSLGFLHTHSAPLIPAPNPD